MSSPGYDMATGKYYYDFEGTMPSDPNDLVTKTTTGLGSLDSSTSQNTTGAINTIGRGVLGGGTTRSAPLYQSLSATSTPQQIAAAYNQYASGAGGDTEANRAAAQQYLSGLGITQPQINSAYDAYKGQAPANPLYQSLSSNSTPAQIAEAYNQYISGAGGDTEANRAEAQRYLQSIGINQPQINAAYESWKSSYAPKTGTTTDVKTTEIDPSQSTLSPNFADYVYRMLAKGEQAADLPFQPYTGERFAGASDLQRQAFSQLGQRREYTPGQFSTGLGALGSVQDYMNPYISAVTDIEAREARRQADIGRQSEQARLAQAGAYGGSRQAIMEAERQRNLGTQIGDITSKGLQGAYDRALQQRLAESRLGLEAQGMGEQSKQFGAKYGLESLGQQLTAGAEERRIAQEPLDFGYQQWQESLKYPYQQATYMQSLLQGLPLTAAPYQSTQGTSGMTSALQGGLAGLALYNLLGS